MLVNVEPSFATLPAHRAPQYPGSPPAASTMAVSASASWGSSCYAIADLSSGMLSSSPYLGLSFCLSYQSMVVDLSVPTPAPRQAVRRCEPHRPAKDALRRTAAHLSQAAGREGCPSRESTQPPPVHWEAGLAVCFLELDGLRAAPSTRPTKVPVADADC